MLIKGKRPHVYLSKGKNYKDLNIKWIELLHRAYKKYEKKINGVNLTRVNVGIQAELKDTGKNLGDESRGLKKGQDDNVLGSALREVGCASGRNL